MIDNPVGWWYGSGNYMTQKIITSRDRLAFKTEVNDALAAGAKVVPGTLSVSVLTCARASNLDSKLKFVDVANLLSVTVEYS